MCCKVLCSFFHEIKRKVSYDESLPTTRRNYNIKSSVKISPLSIEFYFSSLLQRSSSNTGNFLNEWYVKLEPK